MPELQRAPERIVRSPAVDSRRWDGFKPRDGDIVVATFPKVGTTWTQRIVDLLVFQTPDIRPFGDMSPWLDSTFFTPVEDDIATLEAQTHRRYIKSHLPLDALPVWDTVKYVHVGRDGRDARLSWQNHEQGINPAFAARISAQAQALAVATGAIGDEPPPPPPEDPRAYLLQWMDGLEAALAGRPRSEDTFFEFEDTYWRERKRPNLLLVHYNDMKADLAGEMHRISDFLEIDTPEPVMAELVEAARFESMKKDGDTLHPKLKLAFDHGADRFMNKGTSGRWREYLGEADAERYQAIVRRAASPGLARWLEGGRRALGEPASSPE